MPELKPSRSLPRDPAALTLQDIKEQLNICRRLFSFEDLEPQAEDDQWQEPKSRWRSNTVKRRRESKRTTYFSDNRALVKGIYVAAMGLR
jgi:hypothetical protein